MKSLLILRHAKSSWKNAYLADHDRPLNNRGKADAPRMGKLLRRQDLTPELIISSSAERALATAEAVALASGYEESIQVTRSLYGADPEDYLAVLRRLPESCRRVMVVGHNPDVEELLELLTGVSERITTANIAHVQLPIEAWAELDDTVAGRLLDLWRPKELPPA